MRIGNLEDIFGGVVLAILLQMAPIERSEQMMDAVLALAGAEISFNNHTVTLWPRAEDIASLDPLLLRSKANLGTGPSALSRRLSISPPTQFLSGSLRKPRKRRP